ncbi:serine/threonine-protein kinase [Pseudofrankia sp. DC12]|uniref:serine/threonine-protein kinase n=1 Tax=Pseudofrankia sp. DC12 TaxID=683315 RepID=UPI001E420347|nr:serine/threonine-protein kinase [Pseudofrankia sp. DC12]
MVGGYQLRARIGEGGMGTVFLATSRAGRPIALKLIRPEFIDHADFRRRFAAEITIARRVQGAYTVPVVDANPDAARPWVATSYIPAPNLSAAVRHAGPLPARAVLGLLAGVAEALESIHEAGVIHRDLKPGNVMVAAEGPLVIDFGLARAVEGTGRELSRPGVAVGTPVFMSPEQVENGHIGHASDIFSLGSTAYFAATGDYPFGGDGTVFHRIEYGEPDWQPVPWPLPLVLTRCLAKTPAHRASCAEIIDLCRRLSMELAVRVDSATVPTAYRGLLGEGWLPDTITAEISTYRRAVATTLARPGPEPGPHLAGVEESSTEDFVIPAPASRIVPASRAPRVMAGILAATAAATLLLLVGALLVVLGHRHGTTATGSASMSPAPTPATLPETPQATSANPLHPASPLPSTAASSAAPSLEPSATATPSSSPAQATSSAPPDRGLLGGLVYLLLGSGPDSPPSSASSAPAR